jgi:hypothetical protein
MDTTMLAPSSRRVVVAVAAALMCSLPLVARAAADAPDSVVVPLHVIHVDREVTKIGIEVALGGGPPRLYELDTGGSGFYAAYDAAAWPTFTPLGESITQHYGSGVEFLADKVRTTVAIPTKQGEIRAELALARITEAWGGPLGARDASTWKDDLARGDGPLYHRFFGNFGGDLRVKDGIASVLPQLPGNLSSGFVVELGCGRGDAQLVTGLTDAVRERFRTRIAMQRGSGETFPHSGLPTYAQRLLHATFAFSRDGATQRLTLPALIDTGGPTTSIHQSDGHTLERALVDERHHLVRPGTAVTIGAEDAQSGRLDLAFTAGTVGGRNRVDVRQGDESFANLGLIPYFRYDVMFDVANGVVGFAPCRERG